MTEILILADDLSGAADCAVAWARTGARTVVLLDAADNAGAARAAAVDLNSRAMAPEEAAAAAARAVRLHYGPGTGILYHKMDSTLRGNWAAELRDILRAAARATGTAPLAVVAPAFPSTGRRMMGGRVLLHGRPLEETEVWTHAAMTGPADVLGALRSGGLQVELATAEQVRSGSDRLQARLRSLAAAGVQAVLCDAETDEDLARIAAASMALETPCLWSGSAGLMRALAAETSPGSAARTAAPGKPVQKPILIAVGSASTVSRRQFEALAGQFGLVSLSVPADALLRKDSAGASDIAQAVDTALTARLDVALAIEAGAPGTVAEGKGLTEGLAALLAPRLSRVGALVITGGETARAALTAAGIRQLELQGEVEPGVPLGRTSGENTIPVITKAGAFGDRDCLIRCRAALKGGAG